MSHVCFLLGVLGFASICALILSERWQGLSPAKVEIAAALAGLSGFAHAAAASLDGANFALSWLFGGVGLLLALGWHLLARRLRSGANLHPKGVSIPRMVTTPTQRSIAAGSSALAFVSALAVYMSQIP